jgi:hypothetical protein
MESDPNPEQDLNLIKNQQIISNLMIMTIHLRYINQIFSFKSTGSYALKCHENEYGTGEGMAVRPRSAWVTHLTHDVEYRAGEGMAVRPRSAWVTHLTHDVEYRAGEGMAVSPRSAWVTHLTHDVEYRAGEGMAVGPRSAWVTHLTHDVEYRAGGDGGQPQVGLGLIDNLHLHEKVSLLHVNHPPRTVRILALKALHVQILRHLRILT